MTNELFWVHSKRTRAISRWRKGFQVGTTTFQLKAWNSSQMTLPAFRRS